MIRVAAMTSSRDDPSSRFRMRQFFQPLRRLGVEAVEYRPWISKYARAPLQLTGLGLASRVWGALAARRHDLVWLNRELITGHATLERFSGPRRLMDVDDAIWLRGRRDFARRIASRCHGVIAGNAAIAEHFRGVTPRIWIVPTAVDTDRWRPTGTAHAQFTVGWSGTAWNLPYVEAIEPALARFLHDHRDSRLLIVCDRPPSFPSLPDGQVEFRKWSPETEVDALQHMDVGLMPLPDTEWTRAKCALKMLCYMSVGLPVVVSPVGAAVEILKLAPAGIAAHGPDSWYDALATLYEDREGAAKMGGAGRGVAVEHYSVTRIAPRLAGIFTEVAGG